MKKGEKQREKIHNQQTSQHHTTSIFFTITNIPNPNLTLKIPNPKINYNLRIIRKKKEEGDALIISFFSLLRVGTVVAVCEENRRKEKVDRCFSQTK